MKKKNLKTYSTFEVAKILGIKRGRFKMWYEFLEHKAGFDENGFVRRVFDEREVRQAMAFKMLVDYGLSRKMAEKMVLLWQLDGMPQSLKIYIDMSSVLRAEF